MTGKMHVSDPGMARAVTETTLEATIIRADGRREHLGVIAFYHRNPLRRLAWRVSRWIRGIRA